MKVLVIRSKGDHFGTGANLAEQNDAYVEGRVVRISPKVSGQVISLRVDDNDAVKAGARVARLSLTAYITLDLTERLQRDGISMPPLAAQSQAAERTPEPPEASET